MLLLLIQHQPEFWLHRRPRWRSRAGDCPGLDAAIRIVAVVVVHHAEGYQVAVDKALEVEVRVRHVERALALLVRGTRVRRARRAAVGG